MAEGLSNTSPLVTALGSGPLGHTSAATARFVAAELCVELHHQLHASLWPGSCPVPWGTEP